MSIYEFNLRQIFQFKGIDYCSKTSELISDSHAKGIITERKLGCAYLVSATGFVSYLNVLMQTLQRTTFSSG
jgi:hypothetical protein